MPKESTMVSWGGEDNYEFNFEPETKKVDETKKKVLNLLITYMLSNMHLIYKASLSCSLLLIALKKSIHFLIFIGSFC